MSFTLEEKVIMLAADDLSPEECVSLAVMTQERVGAIKIHSTFDQCGRELVRALHSEGARVWIDLKLHDIPNTVRLRAKALAEAGADIITVHASGGIEMMRAAVESGIEVYAITVLTSLSEEETHLLHGHPSKAAVLYLARQAKMAGVHGVVCSPKEVGILSKRPELQGLKFITPGIRSAGKSLDDQQRVDTPAAALKAGAHRLVIGRQITKSPDPYNAVTELEAEITEALSSMEVRG